MSCSCRTGSPAAADEVAACRAPLDIGAETQEKSLSSDLDIQEIGKTLAALVKHLETQSGEMRDIREAVAKLQMQSAAIREEQVKTGDEL